MVSRRNTSSGRRALQVTINREEFLKLRGETRIQMTSEGDGGQYFQPVQTEITNGASR